MNSKAFGQERGLVTLLKALMRLHSRKAFNEPEVKSSSIGIEKNMAIIDGLDIAAGKR